MAQDKYGQGRLDGMDYAIRQIEKEGLEEFKKEYAWRNRNRITVPITQKELAKATEQTSKFMLKFFLALTIGTLYDDFDFGIKGLAKFKTKFELGSEYINKGYAYLQEYIDGIKEQTGIDLDDER